MAEILCKLWPSVQISHYRQNKYYKSFFLVKIVLGIVFGSPRKQKVEQIYFISIYKKAHFTELWHWILSIPCLSLKCIFCILNIVLSLCYGVCVAEMPCHTLEKRKLWKLFSIPFKLIEMLVWERICTFLEFSLLGQNWHTLIIFLQVT